MIHVTDILVGKSYGFDLSIPNGNRDSTYTEGLVEEITVLDDDTFIIFKPYPNIREAFNFSHIKRLVGPLEL